MVCGIVDRCSTSNSMRVYSTEKQNEKLDTFIASHWIEMVFKKKTIYIQWLAIKVFNFSFCFSVEYTLMLLLVEHLSTMPQTITAALGRTLYKELFYENVVNHILATESRSRWC